MTAMSVDALAFLIFPGVPVVLYTVTVVGTTRFVTLYFANPVLLFEVSVAL